MVIHLFIETLRILKKGLTLDHPLVYVKESGIHGKGLFAKSKIRRGEVIGAIKPVRAKKDGPYVLWLSEEEGYRVNGPLKYINHHPKPNAAYCDDLTVVALRAIKPEEEITHHYGDDWE